jgi:hypothetical protein
LWGALSIGAGPPGSAADTPVGLFLVDEIRLGASFKNVLHTTRDNRR